MEPQPQHKESKWHKWLPPDVQADEEEGEHQAWLQHAVLALGRAVAAGDATRSGRQWVRAIQTHVLELRRASGPDDTRAQLVHLLYSVVVATDARHPSSHSSSSSSSSPEEEEEEEALRDPYLGPTLQAKWATVLTRLLR